MRKFPKEKGYYLKAKSECLINLQKEQSAENLYKNTEISPFKEEDILNDYFRLLQRINRLLELKRSYEKMSALNRDDMAKLFLLYLYQNNYQSAEDLLDKWSKEKKKKEDLEAISFLYLKIGKPVKASKYLYTLYYLKKDEACLYQLFICLLNGQRMPLNITPHTLSSYLNLTRFDSNPSIYGGIASLLLNDSNYYQREEDLNVVSISYFNSGRLLEIFKIFKEKFPKSHYLPEIHKAIIEGIYSYADYNLCLDYALDFIKKYPKSSQFFDIYLKVADCFFSLNNLGVATFKRRPKHLSTSLLDALFLDPSEYGKTNSLQNPHLNI